MQEQEVNAIEFLDRYAVEEKARQMRAEAMAYGLKQIGKAITSAFAYVTSLAFLPKNMDAHKAL